MNADPAHLLGPDGPLARCLPGFRPRAQQQTMARAVARTLEEGGVLVAEAGTGTGKTFAYLVPALLSGGRVIISTGTRNLQDQLFHQDLPRVRRALERPVRTALLKGRANYLCLHRLEVTETSGRFRSREQTDQFRRIREWAGRTGSGDISEVGDLPEDSPLWGRVTSTADNCLGGQCPRFQDCHVLKARRQALEAEVVVINHHLFFADMAIREEGFGELLPGADGVILDEAHQLAEVAGQFFGVTLTARQLLDLSRDGVAEQLKEAPDAGEIPELARALDKAVADLRLALGEGERRGSWAEVALEPEMVTALADLGKALERLTRTLAEAAPRGKGLESVHQRAVELQERLIHLSGETPPDSVHWFETRGRGLALHLTPLEIATQLRGQMERHPGAWVFTSATLAVGEDFGHFTQRLGLPEDSATLRLDSPFDFPRHGLLYHPQGLPDPNHPAYTRALMEAALPVLEASRGRAFMLFTSYRALREAAEVLEGRLDYPLLIQGSQPRRVLLERFKALGNAVLLGTGSFWEGVDVRGPALSCVIIDKLPFASPGDPVLAARIDALRRQGGNPFMEVQLPQAVITLKQGVGRLIRDVDDRGVLMLGDPRLLSRPYGQLFLDSLPPMTRTRLLERVERFFALEQALGTQVPSP